LGEEQQEEHDVNDCECPYAKSDSRGAFLKRRTFEKRSYRLVSKTLLTNKEAT
jgi:hypothetical protein